MDNILPIKYPLITSIPTVANFLAMISAYNDTENWIFSNYIQILFRDHPNLKVGAFTNSYYFSTFCPHFTIQTMNNKFLEKFGGTCVNSCINLLNSSYYLLAGLDKFYIKHHPIYYQKHHFFHSHFIFGYNKDAQIFKVANFFYDGKYSFEDISFDELEIAFSETIMSAPNRIFQTFQYVKEQKYFLDIDKIRNHLENFLNSENSYFFTSPDDFQKEHKNQLFFGLSYYDKYIKSISDYSTNNIRISTYILLDHKRMMLKRVDFLNEKKLIKRNYSVIKELYERLCNDTLITLNLIIKMELKNDDALRQKIISNLENIKHNDEIATSLLLDSI